MPIARKSGSLARKPFDPDDFRAPLSDHLDELRARILRSLGFLTAGWVGGWFIAGWLNKVLLTRVLGAIQQGAGQDTKIQPAFTDATQPFLVLLKQSFMVGLLVALPFIAWQIWGFVAPGLKESEKRPLRTAVPISVALFFVGVFFCWLILPAAYQWFGSFMDTFPGAALNQNPEQAVAFSLKMMAAFGICFQLPLIVYALGRLGILAPETMMQYWRQATVFIFFAAAAITPSNDPISMLMMAIPLCVLFAVSVYAVRMTTQKDARLTGEAFPELD
jgi:sec-independent protein translocase protein TatC